MTLALGCPTCRTVYPLATVCTTAPDGGLRGACDCGADTVPVLTCDTCERRVRVGPGTAGKGWRPVVGAEAVTHVCGGCAESEATA